LNILVFNVGSTTLKFACIESTTGTRLSHGIIDRIGQAGGDAEDHLSAARTALDRHSHLSVQAIGHRMVQGGDKFSAPTLVDAEVLRVLRSLDDLAPLHNPPARTVLQAMADANLAIPQVLVFDTAYFATLPPAAYRYAIPDRFYLDYGVRRYGAHGTSHRFVTMKAISYLDGLKKSPTTKRIISLHLGGGASVTASIDGIAVETSMGMTPLEGLVMATRSGDIDPAVPLYLMRCAGLSVDEVDALLNKKSGLLGICGDQDMRTILRRQDDGDESAKLAIDIYLHRLIKKIGSYYAILGGLDALIFTAGVGENSCQIRERVTHRLNHIGVGIDSLLNATVGHVASSDPSGIIDLSSETATVRTLIVPTNEELAIAEQAASLIAALN
jgi:acetate kinase